MQVSLTKDQEGENHVTPHDRLVERLSGANSCLFGNYGSISRGTSLGRYLVRMYSRCHVCTEVPVEPQVKPPKGL